MSRNRRIALTVDVIIRKDDGTIVVPPDKLDDFAKDCWKAIAWVIRHGSPA